MRIEPLAWVDPDTDWSHCRFIVSCRRCGIAAPARKESYALALLQAHELANPGHWVQYAEREDWIGSLAAAAMQAEVARCRS